MKLRIENFGGVQQIIEGSFRLKPLESEAMKYVHREGSGAVEVGERLFHFCIDCDDNNEVEVETAWHGGDTVDSLALLYNAATEIIKKPIIEEAYQLELLKKRINALKNTGFFEAIGSLIKTEG